MSRSGLSRPVQLALADGVLHRDRTLFDFGCGKGGDIARLHADGYRVDGWDPAHSPTAPVLAADVVNLGYVVNVIEDRDERAETVRRAWDLAGAVLVVAARPDWEESQVRGHPRGDGIVTSKGTFQKFFGQDELRGWIGSLTGSEPVAAGPGIFYVFRDPAEAAGVRARRFRVRRPGTPRPRQADALWASHRELLEPLAEFWEDRGRLPDRSELAGAAEIELAVGSLRAAAGVLRRVLGDERFEQARRAAEDNLSVFLALEAFRGRPRFSDLPGDVVLDVRSLFGTYKSACSAADELLYGMADEERLSVNLRSIPFGKILPDAVYVHVDYVAQLPPLVRVYEGAGRALLGEVQDVTLVKLSRSERRISYLSYPTFERDAHPALATSLRADLRSFHVKWRDYRESPNPPVLHRKEAFVPGEHPSRAKFARLTAQEERAGLYSDPTRIGTRDGWEAALASVGRAVVGHRLRRAVPGDSALSDVASGDAGGT